MSTTVRIAADAVRPDGRGGPLATLWRHRQLIWQLGLRQVQGKFRGSVLGAAWSFVTPLLLLAVYAFVFVVVWHAGDGTAGGSLGFALQLFCGLVVYQVFAETLARAPSCIASQPNYVKKVVFPLAALPAADLLAAAVHGAAAFAVLLLATLLLHGAPGLPVLALPLVLPPLLGLTLGAAWLVAALGVYFRDLQSIIGVVLTMLMFLTPVFWSRAQWPAEWQVWLWCNPLAVVVEATRDCLLRSQWPPLLPMVWAWLAAAGVAWLGHSWFQRCKRGFANVL